MKWRNGLFDFIRKLYRDRRGEWERERETAVRGKMDWGVEGETGNCAILPNVISEVILCCVFSVLGCLCTL